MFEKKSKLSAVDHVIEQIKQALLSGQLKAGMRLSTETELAEDFNVSRGSVRSAMKVFETCGIIDIRPGDGTYIRREVSESSFNPLIFSLCIMNPSMDTLTCFRRKIELDMLDLIISSPDLSAAIIPAMESNIQDADRLLNSSTSTKKNYAQNNREFCYLLADYCGNEIFKVVYKYVFEFFSPYIDVSRCLGSIATSTHKIILLGIKTNNFSLAKEAINKAMADWNNSRYY